MKINFNHPETQRSITMQNDYYFFEQYTLDADDCQDWRQLQEQNAEWEQLNHNEANPEQ